jgi:hypothetical protein
MAKSGGYERLWFWLPILTFLLASSALVVAVIALDNETTVTRVSELQWDLPIKWTEDGIMSEVPVPQSEFQPANKMYVDQLESRMSQNSLLVNGTNQMTSTLNAGSNKIENLATPAEDTDGVNKAYVDSQTSSVSSAAVLRDGSQAMSGHLDLGNNKIENLATPTQDADGVTKAYVDGQTSSVSSAAVLRDGSQAMSGHLDLGNNKIENLATPTQDADGATKAYVDSFVDNTVRSYISMSDGLASDIAGGTAAYTQDVENAFEVFANNGLQIEGKTDDFKQDANNAAVTYTGAAAKVVRFSVDSVWKGASLASLPLSIGLFKNGVEISGHVFGFSPAAITSPISFQTSGIVTLNQNDVLSIRVASNSLIGSVSISCLKLNFIVQSV